ncbi:hypothetical protein BJ165DRAFT_1409231 [Panaeolus papilionaceus]|nr:hypothetical protein BJ165DRAFT_1409231 [Panaeolus papilionaceus]
MSRSNSMSYNDSKVTAYKPSLAPAALPAPGLRVIVLSPPLTSAPAMFIPLPYDEEWLESVMKGGASSSSGERTSIEECPIALAPPPLPFNSTPIPFASSIITLSIPVFLFLQYQQPPHNHTQPNIANTTLSVVLRPVCVPFVVLGTVEVDWVAEGMEPSVEERVAGVMEAES